MDPDSLFVQYVHYENNVSRSDEAEEFSKLEIESTTGIPYVEALFIPEFGR